MGLTSCRRSKTWRLCRQACVLAFLIMGALLILVPNHHSDTSLTRQIFNRLYLGKKYELRALSDLTDGEHVFCEGHLATYADNFAHFKSVSVDTCNNVDSNHKRVDGRCVLSDPSDLKYGFFAIPCDGAFTRPTFESGLGQPENHLNHWMKCVKGQRKPADVRRKISGLTIAVMRYEYVNLYHSMTDFYNAFLMMRVLDKEPTETNIIFIDAHPKGSLYSSWERLFKSVTHIKELEGPTIFDEMVWSIVGYNSPMYVFNTYLPTIPLLEDFRHFFLEGHGVDGSRHRALCGRLSVLFVWRRDYIAHPRNPTGLISRKISNEEELVIRLKKVYPSFKIEGMQLDRLDMTEQLTRVAQADVLIGMHGAGLTHAAFLGMHAGLVELFPTYWRAGNPNKHIGNTHFLGIVQWRGMHYEQWVNTDRSLEEPRYHTRVPPEIIVEKVDNIVKKICPES